MGVRARIALFFAGIMALVLVGAGALAVSQLGAQLRAAIDDGLRSRAAVLARDVNEEFGDVGRGEGVLDEADVIAQILGPSGSTIESTAALGPRPLLSRAAVTSLRAPRSLETVVRVDGEPRRARLLATPAHNGTVVVVGSEIEDVHEALAALMRLLWLGGPAVLVLATGAVWALTGVALRPVERMRSEAEALSFGIKERRLPVPRTRDEIARLAQTLNDMLARLEEALERERRFVDDASHELRTPLAVLKTELELALRRSRSADELEAAVRSAAEEVEDLSQLAEHLLLLARADRGLLATKRTRSDVVQLVEQLCTGVEQRAKDRGVRLRTDLPRPVWVEIDPLLVRQALSNIVDNALRHTPPGGDVSLGVSCESSWAEVVVSDSGRGFDAELLPRAFEPFARSDGARVCGSGAGLGLAIVRAVAEAHGGTAEARNRESGGASVVLRLPA